MNIPENIIANADDLGCNPSVNKAILACFEKGYINSTSLMTNTPFFEQTIELIKENPVISNIGIHVDLAEGKPLSAFKGDYLDAEGNWDVYKTNKVSNWFNGNIKTAFLAEINAQIERALEHKIRITHLDSHVHLHTLPCFYKLFLTASKKYELKLRLAQTYYEGSYLKFYYRKYVNSRFSEGSRNYSDRFETVDRFLADKNQLRPNIMTEIMFHPWFDSSGLLGDHYDADTLTRWITFLENQ